MYNTLYHGSPILFNQFSLNVKTRRTENETNSLGIWFSDDYNVCKNFAIKYYTKRVPSKTEFWEDGKPKIYLKDRFQVGWIYEVQHQTLNLKEYNINDDVIIKNIEHLDLLEKNINHLREELKKQDSSDGFSFIKSPKYREIQQNLNNLITEYHFSKASTPEDSFDIFMHDRDQFCQYISGEKGKTSWKERYCLMNKEEANDNFMQYLKNEGYDGFVIVDTVYDSPNKTKHNQYCIFNLDKIKIIKSQKLNKMISKEELLQLQKTELRSQWF